MDFLKWVMWHLMCRIVELFDKKRMDSSHWTWAIYPSESVKRMVQKDGCIFNYAKRRKLVWLVDVVRGL